MGRDVEGVGGVHDEVADQRRSIHHLSGVKLHLSQLSPLVNLVPSPNIHTTYVSLALEPRSIVTVLNTKICR